MEEKALQAQGESILTFEKNRNFCRGQKILEFEKKKKKHGKWVPMSMRWNEFENSLHLNL